MIVVFFDEQKKKLIVVKRESEVVGCKFCGDCRDVLPRVGT